MAVTIESLLPSLYRALQDTDREDPTYSDNDLEGLLKDAVAIVEGVINKGYSVDGCTIVPDPPPAMQMIFVLKAALMQRIYEVRYSYDTHVLKVTRTSKKEDIEFLNSQLQEMIQELEWTAGSSMTEWDDYMFKIERIMDAMSKGGVPHSI